MTTHWQYALLGLSLTAGVFVRMLLLLEVGRRIGRRRAVGDPKIRGQRSVWWTARCSPCWVS